MSHLPCCQASLNHGRSTCLHCGAALHPGRAPTAQEQYLTSEEYRMLRLERIEEARQYNDNKDLLVLAVIAKLQHLAEFTWDDLAGPTAMPASALKHQLDRLERKCHIKKVGRVKVRGRAGRFRPVYQRLLPHDLPIPSSAPKEVVPKRRRRSTRHASDS
jgi:hypothetical protein